MQKVADDDVNFAGRLIVHFLAGAEDPAKVDEILGVFDNVFDYDFEKGDTFKLIQTVIAGGNPDKIKEMEEFRKGDPEGYRRLGKALADLAKKYREFTDYVPSVASPTPAGAPAQAP